MPKKSSKQTAPTEPSVEVSAPASTPSPVVEVSKEDDSSNLTSQFSDLLAQLALFKGHLSGLTAQVRALQKSTEREVKTLQKKSKSNRKKAGNRAPSGFVKPTLISTELAKFLGKPSGTEMARTEVTREINNYIRQHKLQDPANGRRILPDSKLTKLLKVKKSDELTYFNLQRYMSPHFQKAGNPPLANSS